MLSSGPEVWRSPGSVFRKEERRGVGSESAAAEEEAKPGCAGEVTIGLSQGASKFFFFFWLLIGENPAL